MVHRDVDLSARHRRILLQGEAYRIGDLAVAVDLDRMTVQIDVGIVRESGLNRFDGLITRHDAPSFHRPATGHGDVASARQPRRRRQWRQKSGVNSTRIVKISSRPSSIARHNTQWEKGVTSRKWGATSPRPGPRLLSVAAIAEKAVT